MSLAYGMRIMISDGSVSFLISDAHQWTQKLTHHEDKAASHLGPWKIPHLLWLSPFELYPS